jgi:hypothetical protein
LRLDDLHTARISFAGNNYSMALRFGQVSVAFACVVDAASPILRSGGSAPGTTADSLAACTNARFRDHPCGGRTHRRDEDPARDTVLSYDK